MSYDLLVCDLDGTLIDDTMTLEPALVHAFHRATAGGLRISLATGRMPAAARRYRDQLRISVPVIYYNGALIRDPSSGRDLLSLTLPRGVVGTAHDVFAQAPVDPLFFREDLLYCLATTPPIKSYCEEEGLQAESIPDPDAFFQLGGFIKSLFIGQPDVLSALRQKLEGLVGDGARLLRTRSTYLELVPAAASKGAAVSRLAAELGVPLERVIAVGDQENDLDMIRVAGLGVAMPHAPAAVKAAAGRVAPTPAEGGLLALFREVLPEHFAEHSA